MIRAKSTKIALRSMENEKTLFLRLEEKSLETSHETQEKCKNECKILLLNFVETFSLFSLCWKTFAKMKI